MTRSSARADGDSSARVGRRSYQAAVRRSAVLLVAPAFAAGGCSLLSGTGRPVRRLERSQPIGRAADPGTVSQPGAGLAGSADTPAPTSPGSVDTPAPPGHALADRYPAATDTPAATDYPPAPSDTPAASPSSQPSGQGFQPAKFTLSLDRVADGLNDPTFITGDGSGDGRKYILERGGAGQGDAAQRHHPPDPGAGPARPCRRPTVNVACWASPSTPSSPRTGVSSSTTAQPTPTASAVRRGWSSTR